MHYSENGASFAPTTSPKESQRGAIFQEDDRYTSAELLDRLVAEQQSMLPAQSFSMPETSSLIPVWYIESPYYKQLRFELDQLKTNTDAYLDENEILGRVFSDIAYAWLLERNHTPENMALSEEQTLRLYRRASHEFAASRGLSPRNVVERELSASLDRMSVPDGVVVTERDGKKVIKRVAEYSTRTTKEKFSSSAGKIKGNLKLLRRLPSNDELFDDEVEISFMTTHALPQGVHDEITSRYKRVKFHKIIHSKHILELAKAIEEEIS